MFSILFIIYIFFYVCNNDGTLHGTLRGTIQQILSIKQYKKFASYMLHN